MHDKWLVTVVAMIAWFSGGSCLLVADAPSAAAERRVFRFSSDFSQEQGQGQWFYRQWDGTKYTDMAWDTGNTRWKGAQTYCLLAKGYAHPDRNEPVIVWKVPRSGKVKVVLVATKGEGGDGVLIRILKGDDQLLPVKGWRWVSSGLSRSQWSVTTDVTAGQELRCHVNQGASNQDDSTTIDVIVSYDLDFVLPLPPKREGDVHVRDYGAIPDDDKDDAEAVRAAIAAAKKDNKRRVVFDAGRYDFKDGKPYFEVAGMSGITLTGQVDANGEPTTRLIRFNPETDDTSEGVRNLPPFIRVGLCENFTIENFTIDTLPYIYSAGRVAKVEKDVVTVDVLSGHPRREMVAAMMGRYDIEKRRILSDRITENPREGLKWKPVEGGSGRFMQIRHGDLAGQVKVGEGVFWFQTPHGGEIIQTFRSTGTTTLQNLRLLSGTGFAFYLHRSENVTMRKVTLAPPPDRLMATPRDGIHINMVSGKVLMEDVHIEGCMDDTLNIHGHYLAVKQRVDAHTVEFEGIRGSGVEELTDDTRFTFMTSEMMRGHEGKTVGWYWKGSTLIAHFAEAVPEWVGKGTISEPHCWNPESTVLRRCTLKNTCVRGIKFSAKHALIDECLFENNIKWAGLLLGSEPGFWKESTSPYDVEVRKCTFRNISGAGISVHSEGYKALIHDNIRIHHNTFDTIQGPAIHLRGVRDCSIVSNTWRNVRQQVLQDKGTTEDVRISD